MKIFETKSTGGFEIQSLEDGILFEDIDCVGTSFATSAKMSPPNSFFKRVVLAHYQDASNFAVSLADLGQTNLEIELWADYTKFNAANNVSIEVFAGTNSIFVSGSDSLLLPVGTGKIFRAIGVDQTASKFVIASIG